MAELDPFAHEVTSLQVGRLTIKSRTDRVPPATAVENVDSPFS